MIIPYVCKFCRKPGETELVGEHVNMYRIEKWLAILCCDRCGDFHSERLSLREKMVFVSVFVEQRRKCNKFTPEYENKCREKLTDLTKRFAVLVCNHYNKVRVWEPEFVDMILHKPEKLNQILWHYIRGVSAA